MSVTGGSPLRGWNRELASPELLGRSVTEDGHPASGPWSLPVTQEILLYLCFSVPDPQAWVHMKTQRATSNIIPGKSLFDRS